jgi:hypothetical protein
MTRVPESARRFDGSLNGVKADAKPSVMRVFEAALVESRLFTVTVAGSGEPNWSHTSLPVVVV